MAKITDIRKCSRPVRIGGKTTMEWNCDKRFFSIWVHAAGQEGGLEACPPSIQLDVEGAKKLCGYLKKFIEHSSE